MVFIEQVYQGFFKTVKEYFTLKLKGEETDKGPIVLERNTSL